MKDFPVGSQNGKPRAFALGFLRFVVPYGESKAAGRYEFRSGAKKETGRGRAGAT